MAKILNRLTPKLSLGSIESKWVSRDPKQVQESMSKVFFRTRAMYMCVNFTPTVSA